MKFSCCSLDKDEMIQITDAGRVEEAINLFKMLTHPTRFKILKILVIEDEICTSELVELGTDPQPAITKQFTNLRKEGIVTARKVHFKKSKSGDEWEKEEGGKWTAYRLAEDKKELITYLLKPFIENEFQAQVPECDVKVEIVCGKRSER